MIPQMGRTFHPKHPLPLPFRQASNGFVNRPVERPISLDGQSMLPADLKRRSQVVTAVIREAGEMAARYYAQRRTLKIESKGVQDLVSEADKACEELIVSRLSTAFPDDSILGEEGGLRKKGNLTWVIDPIDGTANFVRGINHWCISVGLLSGDSAVLGLILDPNADELFAAAKGLGATLNGEPIRISGQTNISEARVGLGFSYRRPVGPHARDVEALLNAHCEYSRLGSGRSGWHIRRQAASMAIGSAI